MKDEIQKMIYEQFKYENIESFEFQEIYGFTFVFKKNIKKLKNNPISGEIYPVGIIYSEHDESYFAPLISEFNCKKIIKEYVKTI